MTTSARTPIRRRFLDGLEHNVFLVFVLAVSAGLHTQLVRAAVGGDTWYTLLGGRVVDHSGLPRHDTLTVLTLGREWVDQQWLAHLGFYALWAAGGWRLATLSVVALYVAAFAVTAGVARRLGASDRAAALVALACYIVALANAALRAQIPAYLLFSLALALLVADARRPSRRVYLVLPLLVLWANIHGSVVLGAGLVALRGATVAGSGLRARAAASRWLPRAVALLALPWACVLASPYGLGLIHYYRSVLGNSTLEHVVTEWGPSSLRSEPFFYALLLVGLWLVARSPATSTPFERLALVGTAVLGLFAVRNIVWFALVAGAVLPPALDALWAPSTAPRRSRVNLGLAAAGLLAALGAAAATAARSDGWFYRAYPPRAAAVVASAARADPHVRVFANERFADWLLFEEPQLAGRVAYDVRFELLTSAQLSTLVAFRTESGLDWQRAARGYGLLVLDPTSDAGAVKLFRRSPGAKVLYRDDQIIVLRTGTASG